MAGRKIPQMSAWFPCMFPENTLTAPEEVLQMILCKCGAHKPCSRKTGSCPMAVIVFEVLQLLWEHVPQYVNNIQ